MHMRSVRTATADCQPLAYRVGGVSTGISLWDFSAPRRSARPIFFTPAQSAPIPSRRRPGSNAPEVASSLQLLHSEKKSSHGGAAWRPLMNSEGWAVPLQDSFRIPTRQRY